MTQTKSMLAAMAAAILSCVGLAGCNDREDPTAFKKGTTMAELKAQSAKIAAQQAEDERRRNPPPLRVRAKDVSGPWPLTKNDVEIMCSGDRILLRTEGETYAFNGTAQSFATVNGWRDIEAIWKFQKKGEPYRVSMSSLLGLAVAHCKIA